MTKKAELYGLSLEPSIFIENGTIYAQYSIEIKTGTFANPLFLTSPKIREIIQNLKPSELNLFRQKFVGEITYLSSKDPKILETNYKPMHETSSLSRKIFKKLGITDKLEYKALTHLENAVREFNESLNQGKISDELIKVLAKRRIFVSKTNQKPLPKKFQLRGIVNEERRIQLQKRRLKMLQKDLYTTSIKNMRRLIAQKKRTGRRVRQMLRKK